MSRMQRPMSPVLKYRAWATYQRNIRNGRPLCPECSGTGLHSQNYTDCAKCQGTGVNLKDRGDDISHRVQY